jgi:hypothetical protein
MLSPEMLCTLVQNPSLVTLLPACAYAAADLSVLGDQGALLVRRSSWSWS